MSRLYVFAAGIIAALSLLVVGVSQMSTPGSSAGAPDINLIAVDTNTNGNTTTTCAGEGCAPGTLSSIQGCVEIDPPGGPGATTADIDIVIDSIPSVVTPNGFGPDIQGFDMDLIYDGSLVNVSAANTNIGIEYGGTPSNGSHSSNTDYPPDSDGDFFLGEIDFGAVGESGPGILARVTLQSVASGISALHLEYTTGGGTPPNVYDNSGNQNAYSFGEVRDALVAVHPSVCPAVTPVPSQSPPVTNSPTPSPTPTIVPVPDGKTAMFFDSEPGDYIGQGQTWYFDTSTTAFTGTVRNAADFLTVDLDTSNELGSYWSADFAVPNGQTLHSGTYTGATRAPFHGPGEPGIDIGGDGRGCNQILGEFTILDVAYTGNLLQTLAVDFEQHCEGGGPALFGELRYNSAVPIDALSITPRSWDYGQTRIGTVSTKSFTIKNVGDTEIHYTGSAIEGEYSESFLIQNDSCKDTTVAAGLSCTIEVAFAPDKGPYYYYYQSAQLAVSDTLLSGKHGASLSGRALLAEIQTNDQVDLGFSQVGTSSQAREITVYNNSDFPVAIGQISITGQNAGDFQITSDTCSQKTLQRNNNCRLQFVLTPTTVGLRTADLHIANDGYTSDLKVRLYGSGYNVADPLLSIATLSQSTSFNGFLTYRISVHNYGPQTATGITISDQIPTLARFISLSGPGSCTTPEVEHTGLVTCQMPDVPSGGVTSFDLTVRVLMPPDNVLSNTAGMNLTSSDPNYSNNHATVDIAVIGAPPSPQPTAGPTLSPTPTHVPTATPTPTVQAVTQTPSATIPHGSSSVTPTPTSSIAAADTNCDGHFDLLDVLSVLNQSSGVSVAGVCSGGDANHDGNVTPLDGLLLLKYWAGLIDYLP